MTTFADTSALVKLYADEPGAAAVRSLHPVVVADVSRVEVVAALWKKVRTGELAPADAELLVAAFEADFFGTHDEAPRFIVVTTTAVVLEAAAALVRPHGLRGFDAIQLASALSVAAVAGPAVTFCACDRQLLAAAAVEGLACVASLPS